MGKSNNEDGAVPRRSPVALVGQRSLVVKIMLAVGAASLLMGIAGGVAINRMGALHGGTLDLYEKQVATQTVGTMRAAFNRARLNALDHFLTEDPAEEATEEKDIAKSRDEVAEAVVKLKGLHVNAEELAALERFAGPWAEYNKITDEQLLPASREGRLEEISKIRHEAVAPLISEMRAAMDELVVAAEADALRVEKQSEATYSLARIVVIAGLFVGMALGLLAAWFVARMVTKPVGKVSDVLAALAVGDLTRRAEVEWQDEVGAMATNLNRALDSLAADVTAIARTADAVASTSDGLAASGAQLAAAAEESSAQAGVAADASSLVTNNVNSLAAGTEQMMSAIVEISASATQAVQVANLAVEAASDVNTTVSKLLESSNEIGEVIGMITGIAAQTNLLALNATIEAARAGEAGKGFAVVASAVQELATETASATAGITARIEAIQSDTNAAVAAIEQINAIVGRINE
ncbi:MAG: methyl-accepting chemotaxis protein, partial [Acidimicrobiales bacterium]